MVPSAKRQKRDDPDNPDDETPVEFFQRICEDVETQAKDELVELEVVKNKCISLVALVQWLQDKHELLHWDSM